jgi:hypothetical protein
MRSLFFKKIKCQCGSNFKLKNYRNKKMYICTKVDKKECQYRIPISEDFIKDLIIRRKGNISDEQMVQILDHVLVRDKWNLEVYFVGNEQPMIIHGNHNFY